MKIKTLIPVLAVSVIASGSVLTSNTALAGSPEAQEVVRIVESNKSGTRIITRAPTHRPEPTPRDYCLPLPDLRRCR